MSEKHSSLFIGHVCQQHSLELIVPFLGTSNLLGWLELAESTSLVVGQVALGPFSETGGDLLNAADGVGLVVPTEIGLQISTVHFVQITSFTGRATVG